MIHKDFPFLTVHWDATLNSVIMEWKKFVSDEQLKEGLNEGLNLIILKKAKNWIADLRKFGAISPEGKNWSNNDWFPRAIKGGIRNMAIVIPESVIAKMSVDEIMQKADNIGLSTHHFSDIEEAKKWIRSQI